MFDATLKDTVDSSSVSKSRTNAGVAGARYLGRCCTRAGHDDVFDMSLHTYTSPLPSSNKVHQSSVSCWRVTAPWCLASALVLATFLVLVLVKDLLIMTIFAILTFLAGLLHEVKVARDLP